MLMINKPSAIIVTAMLVGLACIVVRSHGASATSIQTAKTQKVFNKTVPVGFSDIRNATLQDMGTLDVSNYTKIRVESRIAGTSAAGVAGEVRLYRPSCASCVVEVVSLGPMLSSRVIELPGTDLQIGAFLFDSASPSATAAANSAKPPIAVEVVIYGSQ